jgi:hypothetical protein
VTYQEFVAAWPLRSGDPFTDKMYSMPKFVAPTTLQEPLERNATLLKGEVAQQVQELKQQPGHRLLTYWERCPGGHAEAEPPDRRLPAHGPSARAGSRKALLPRGRQDTLMLTDAKTTSTGVVVLTY